MGINLRSAERLTPERYDRTYPGTVVSVGTELRVSVMGNVITARWADPLSVSEGDSVLVRFDVGRTGGAEAFVVSRVGNLARPARGTVSAAPVGSSTITVTGTDGASYTAYYASNYSPVVSDEVLLSWTTSTPTVTAKVAPIGSSGAAAPAAAAPVAPPPPPPQTGSNTYWATASNTYWEPGGWGSWAGGRGRVYQGNYGSGEVYGAWFYGGGPTQLKGRTITKIRFYLGSRLAVGSYNSQISVHFYATDAMNQPGGLYTAVAGPADGIAWPGQGITEYDLTGYAEHILNGGGIGIFGSPYAGFMGRNEQADSGKLIIDWRS